MQISVCHKRKVMCGVVLNAKNGRTKGESIDDWLLVVHDCRVQITTQRNLSHANYCTGLSFSPINLPSSAVGMVAKDANSSPHC